jgi:hypothetical protein
MDQQLLAIILAIVGWGVAAFFALRSTKKRKPVWAYRTTPILGINSKTPAELKLVFNGRSVDDVYRTEVIFFNAGNQTIEASDVRKQVTLAFKNAKILREPNINASDAATEFSAAWSASAERSELKLGFKCLDHNDGAVLEVIHDGKGKVSCDGMIKETKEITFLGKFIPPVLGRLPGNLIVGFVLSGVWLALVLGLLIFGGVDWIVGPAEVVAVLIAFGLPGWLLGQTVAALLKRRRFPAWSALSE